jgi:hypothetical protein
MFVEVTPKQWIPISRQLLYHSANGRIFGFLLVLSCVTPEAQICRWYNEVSVFRQVCTKGEAKGSCSYAQAP